MREVTSLAILASSSGLKVAADSLSWRVREFLIHTWRHRVDWMLKILVYHQ